MITALVLAGIVLASGAGAILTALAAVSLLWLLDRWQDRNNDDGF